MYKKNMIQVVGALSLVVAGSVFGQQEAADNQPEKQQVEQYLTYAPAGLEKETPTILDSDQDGVTLDKDQCLGTPFNVDVNENGCSFCPEGSLEDKEGCYYMEKITKSYPIRVNFPSRSYEIPDQYKPEINQLVEMLKDNLPPKIVVEGHTDNMGSDEYNLELSQQRADSVTRLMISYGIPSSIIVGKGFGEGSPIADNAEDEGRRQNRRVTAVAEMNEEQKKYTTRY
ncbi:Peptidoglycan-associated lipoprotein [Sinobacterium norvegicum]|uniref:Peptidoglycan-associated lipoprotein n=1 Tax=Sinobacterium norvegicum TaxID=1641715 RepID=A0ABM9AJL8_9GAMM|nr:OmpA family protein [Sinobacterium norvegicum]CAH0993432.1 Peptidoglycan-associated lipoprotein [Sinobacterium norvegicum]